MMERIAFLAVAIAFTAGCQTATTSSEWKPSWFFGLGRQERAAVLLYMPREGTMDWEEFLNLFERIPDLKMTLAVPPEIIPESRKEEINGLASEGRLEVCIRPLGDPVLPLVHNLSAPLITFEGAPPEAEFSRPQDVASRIALAKQGYQKVLDEVPAGIAPAGGAIVPGLFPIFRSLAIKWAASGEYTVVAATAAHGARGTWGAGSESETPTPEASETLIRGAAPHEEPVEEDETAAWYEDEPEDAAEPSPVESRESAPPQSSWLVDRELVILPFGVVSSSEAALDWSLSPLPKGNEGPSIRSRPLLLALEEISSSWFPEIAEEFLKNLEDADKIRWQTVSQAVEDHEDFVPFSLSGPVRLATWRGDYSPWVGGSLQNAAWSLLARASRDLDRYRNSGRASLRRLDSASKELYNAVSARYLEAFAARLESEEWEEMEKEFRETLCNVYRLIRRSVPDVFYKTLGEISGEQAEHAPQEGGWQGEALPTVSSYMYGTGWFSLLDPEGDALPPPAVTPPVIQRSTAALPPGTTEYAVEQSSDVYQELQSSFAPPWDLKQLRLKWDDSYIAFGLMFHPAENDQLPLVSLNQVLVDVYVDLNQRVGAGSLRLLPGRKTFTEPANAWEFALSLTSQEAALYRARRQGTPVKIATLSPIVDVETNGIEVLVPRSKMRGNPTAWGYIVISMALNTAQPKDVRGKFFQPLSGEPGIPILDALDPLDHAEGISAPYVPGKKVISAIQIPSQE